MISTILFDVDGVLVTSDPFSVTLAREHHITTDMTVPFFRGPFRQCLTGHADLKAEIASHLPTWGWRGSVEEFLDLWFTTSQQLDANLLAAAQRLRQRGIHCYLATNQERYRTDYLLTRMGLASQFDGCYSSAHIGYMKDNPAFFQQVLQTLPGTPASDVLFWDDSPGNVATARIVGLLAEVYTTFVDFEQRLRQYL
jgi:putative hydrolase of the HAD superfamily